LQSAKGTSALGPDEITYTSLENLSEEHKEELLDYLEQIDGLGFTIYAHNITLWFKGGSIGQQENTLQEGLHKIEVLLQESDLSTESGYKTNRRFGLSG
ncbi:unnamed protein product, partial [Ixodes persulcatus]